MTRTERLNVEVAYATPDEQVVVPLAVPSPCSALQAVELSGLVERFALDRASLRLGVFGKVVSADHLLLPHDRVEIYRPLLADPKEVRRRRARAQKA